MESRVLQPFGGIRFDMGAAKFLATGNDPASHPNADPRVLEIFSYWKQLRRNRRLPALRDLNPADFPDLLPYIALIEVDGNPPSFNYKLVGAHLVECFRSDPTGRAIGEVNCGPLLPDQEKLCRTVANDGRALYAHTISNLGDSYDVEAETLLLPLSDDGKGVNVILLCLAQRYVYGPDPYATRPQLS